MYEHPIKRFGLTMNRIVLSNTRMVAEGFPMNNPQKYDIHFKYREFAAGKATSMRLFTSKDQDDLLPSRKRD
jgi:hypothetical protein